MARFFVNPEQVKGKQIEIKGQDVKHIRDVLRLSLDDQITICDGQGIDYQVAIAQIDQDFIMANILNHKQARSETNVQITLFQSLIKGNRFEWVIQKAVEIGVYKIVPMTTAHCVVKIKQDKKAKTKLTRWNNIAQSAAKQSGRGIIPVVENPVSYMEAIQESRQMDFSCMAYEKETSGSLKNYLQSFQGKSLGIFIGPEGGFSKEEVAMAQETQLRSITLGPRILRSETASIVLLSNMLYELGEMDL